MLLIMIDVLQQIECNEQTESSETSGETKETGMEVSEISQVKFSFWEYICVADNDRCFATDRVQ